MEAEFKAIADHALLVIFGAEINEAVHANVVALDKAISNDPPFGVTETIPALVNLLIDFDPLITDHLAVEAEIRSRIECLQSSTVQGVDRVVHVCYDQSLGPDLASVAKASNLSTDAVIKAHLSADFQVLMYGFAPGYAYLGGIPKSIQVPRKPAPVRDVPAGSVIIAGPQCLVTTLLMPTGWSIIGRSPTKILTEKTDQPFLFNVGDRVRFERIDLDTFNAMSNEVSNG